MKRLIATLAFGALILGSPAAWADQVYRLQIDGLACPFCAYGVEKKLKAVEGVKRLEISINKGEIIVTLEDGAAFDEEEARQLVADAGFALRGFRQVEGQD